MMQKIERQSMFIIEALVESYNADFLKESFFFDLNRYVSITS